MNQIDDKTPAKVAVITGGAGGMGLATAKILGRDHHLLLCDVNQQRLDEAQGELQGLGFECSTALCDVTDRGAVDTLLKNALEKGPLACVVHTAGLSPQMADPETILRVNALGTINMTEACARAATEGFALVNVASNSAHMLPALMVPTGTYRHALTDPEKLLRKLLFRCRLLPKDFYRRGIAYAISKHFVMWYSRESAARFGEVGARIVSVSPGSFDTAMGRLEEKSGSAEMLKDAALKRFGRPQEIAEVLAFCASDRASYLTGTDVLCDGGVVAGRR